MALPITFNNTVYPAGYFGTDDGGAPTNSTHSFRIDDVYNFPVTVNGTVTGPNSTITITYTYPGRSTPTTQTLTATPYDNSNMILFTGTNGVPGAEDGTTNRFVFSNIQMYGNGDPNRTTFADDGNSTLGNYAVNPPPTCFTTGTNILAIRDGHEVNVKVEDLQIGDLAVTASGSLRPIRWIGHRAMRPADYATPWDFHPVRIRAGAFGPGLPERDLLLSPGHPVLVGEDEAEHLVPIMCLVNGTTIERVSVDEVTYWHVELDAHDILLAEGLPAESYLDWGDRAFFAEGSDHALQNPDFVVPGLGGRCRPVAVDGPIVEAARRRLDAAFAASLGAMCAWPSFEKSTFA